MRLSIRYKILGVTGFLSLAALAAYTALASSIFIEEKTALLYDVNHSTAVNSAAQLGATLGKLSEQAKVYALYSLSPSGLQLAAPGSVGNPIMAWRLYREQDENLEARPTPAGFADIAEAPESLQAKLRLALSRNAVFWRSGAPGKPFLLATRMQIWSGAKPQTYLSVAQVDPKPIFDILVGATVFESYLVDSEGQVLAHLNQDKEVETQTLAGHPLLSATRNPSHVSGVQSYKFEGDQHYGAFAPIGVGDLYFFSQAGQDQVQAALQTLLQRSALFGAIVLTLTFIATLLLSKSLTRNLQTLAAGAQAIGAGDLNTRIDIRSGDEVQSLANSFNDMVRAVRESREAIETSNRELDRKVAQRTEQLSETNARIKDVQEKLLQATQLAAVGEVAGRTAHELLNPLTAIVARLEKSASSIDTRRAGAPTPAVLRQISEGWKKDFQQGGMPALTSALAGPSSVASGKTLLEEDLGNLETLANYWQMQIDAVAEDVRFVREQSNRLYRIVDKMRERVRVSSKSVLSCRAAVEEAVNTMGDFLAQRGTKITLEWDATRDEVELNRDELIQILTNLIRNGYQAIPSGRQGMISIRGGNSGHLLWIDVLDNGAGVAPENRGKLFDQGFTTKPPSEGTGLGLSICRRYAHAFGGEVELLFSEPGARGTCFRVTIPVKNA